tara:strand:+ start:1475 stop:2038 length:564 start_codon:yes stop_codon:yes gene_type:complete
MANADAPRGFWPIRHLTGGTIRTGEYTIASGYAADIFTGDIVKLVAAGGIELSAAGARSVGVFGGVEYTDASGNVVFKAYWPTGTVATNIKAVVYDDPMTVFGVQSAGSTVAADVGNLGDHVATAGSTSTGLSANELNGTTSTAYAGFRVFGKVNTPDNAYGTNVNLEVQLVEHEFMPGNEATTPGV